MELLTSTEKTVLNGTLDMHVHSYPEFSLDFVSSRDDLLNIDIAKSYGMKGMVLKSHTFPTIGKARILDRLAGDDFSVLGSITLNQITGGISPVTVELAAKLGCKVVHMPTWSAKHDLANNIAYSLMTGNNESAKALTPEKDGISIYDADGKVSQATMEVLELVKKYDLVLFTGHMSCDEALKITELCKEMGITKCVFCHPLCLCFPWEETEKAIANGAYVEFTHINIHPIYGSGPAMEQFEGIKGIVDKYGSDQLIITSDHFDSINPTSGEMVREFASMLIKFGGLDAADIHKMVATNPAKLLDL